jgi:HNH endonuclease
MGRMTPISSTSTNTISTRDDARRDGAVRRARDVWRVVPRPEPLLGPFVDRNGIFFLPIWSRHAQRRVFAVVPTRMYNTILTRRWHLDTHGYPTAGIGGRSVPLHHLVVGAFPQGHFVDHVNRDVLDLRDENLRILTPAESSVNRRRPRLATPASSRFRGVTAFRPRSGIMWQAAAHSGNRCMYFGLHRSEVAAAIAYNRGARKLWPNLYVRNDIPVQRTTTTAWASKTTVTTITMSVSITTTKAA